MTKTQQLILTVTRIIFGMLFLEAGMRKLLSDFTADKYLLSNTAGPFSDIFSAMAGNNLVNFLVIFGEIGIGLALILGILVWFASLSGILMMMLYYLSAFPPTSGFVSLHLVYIMVFLVLWLFHAEDYLGFEKQFKQILSKISGRLGGTKIEVEE